MQIHSDCIHFRGDIPCKPHKTHGYHCAGCPQYQAFSQRILIIKLGAAGDVIRTTPLLHKLTATYPQAEITWITDYPVLVPASKVHRIMKWSTETHVWALANHFDILYNLDKDPHAIALASMIDAKEKHGYLQDAFGKCKPANEAAQHKWLTGLFDDLCLQNTKSYPQEILEMCGFSWDGEEYILELPPKVRRFELPQGRIIGMNTGCGTRWLTRLWGEENWIALAKLCSAAGYIPLLLGGPVEDQMNRHIATHSPAHYLGTFPLDEFLHLVNHCDCIISSVTMSMHIAIGLHKKLVLFNNIFNRHEFELYGHGTILEPDGKSCLGCYRNHCDEPCMKTIPPQLVLDTINDLLRS